MVDRIEFEEARGNVEPIKYCGYGSCDGAPGHVGGHRCRCGKLVAVPSPKCAWHQSPPKPMTTSLLKAYLEFAADGRPIEDQPVLIKGEPIVNAHIKYGHVILETWEDFLERGRVEKESGQ